MKRTIWTWCRAGGRHPSSGGITGIPAIAPALRGLLDVVVVGPEGLAAANALPAAAVRARWRADRLVAELGFHRVVRSSLVVDVEGRVLALMVADELLPSLGLAATAGKLPAVHTTLSQNMNANRTRPGIFMFGLRFNENGYRQAVGRRIMRTGWYPCKTVARAIALRRDANALGTIVGAAEGMCAAEAAVAPAMAAHRLQHATTGDAVDEDGNVLKGRLPGLFPGVDLRRCPAGALGVSKGYVSDLHVDRGSNNMSETILWDVSNVSNVSNVSDVSDELAFTVAHCGVVFGIGRASRRAVLFMVPCALMHGTVAPQTPGGNAEAIGAVIVNKRNLKTEDAMTDIGDIHANLDDGILCNPLISTFSVKVEDSVCQVCTSESAEEDMILCDECNKGYHARCLRICMPRADWVCDDCSACLGDRPRAPWTPGTTPQTPSMPPQKRRKVG